MSASRPVRASAVDVSLVEAAARVRPREDVVVVHRRLRRVGLVIGDAELVGQVVDDVRDVRPAGES